MGWAGWGGLPACPEVHTDGYISRETDNTVSFLGPGDSSRRRLSAEICIITDEVKPNMVAVDS